MRRLASGSNAQYPVYIVLTDEGGQPKAEGSSPGYTQKPALPFITVVDRFP